jgi:phenylpropionate dioxygenase-like ring-hydroxylating dioxygenase large terminal subunit
VDEPSFDQGTAYELPEPSWRHELVAVGRGTPMGELLRRYWHPVALSGDAGDTPRLVRALGEDLVLFRDGRGRPGLLHPRCAHRGASLYYGRVEDDGLRCCYHGWKFDIEGRCLDQPCEPQAGARLRANVRQPWYALEERYGLIFAYLGPPHRRPLLPSIDALETLADGEFIEADDSSIGSGGPAIVPCNWLQHFENVVDPFHVPILHGGFSGMQFTAALASMPDVDFEETPRGVRSVQRRTLDDGRRLRRVTEAALPTLRVVPSPRVGRFGPVESIGWVLPIDDTHFRIYVAGRVTEHGELSRMRSTFGGRAWRELSEAEHRAMPGDYEAQVSQGPITWHSHEHLRSSDRGIALLRRMLARQVEAVAAGGDPIGTAFEASAARVRFDAGNWLET